MQTLTRFWRDESGPELVEWAVVTAVLLGATAAVVIALRDEVLAAFTQIFDALEDPPPDSFTN